MKTKLLLTLTFVLSSLWNLNAQTMSFQWAKGFGSSGDDIAAESCIDPNGNIYTVGYFNDTTDLNPGPGIEQKISNGQGDIFIQKLDANGNFVWAKTMGSSKHDQAVSVHADNQGNIYVVGGFYDTVNFNTPSSPVTLISSGFSDGFVLKMNSQGNFLWVKKIGGSNNDYITDVEIDNAGNIFLGGHYAYTVDFDPGPGTHNKTSSNLDFFLLKLDASGNFQWVRTPSGPGHNYISGLEVDNDGNVYSIGTFGYSMDFDPGPGLSYKNKIGDADVFIQKYSASGDFQWVKTFGYSNSSYQTYFSAGGIALDKHANVYTTGGYVGLPDLNTDQGVQSGVGYGGKNIFIHKLDSSGSFKWAKVFGNSGDERGYSVATDTSDNVYVTGVFTGTIDFDPGSGVKNLSGYFADAFTLKLDSAGAYKWVQKIGSNRSNEGHSVILDQDQNIYTSGRFGATVDFDPGSQTYNLTAHGTSLYSGDAFIQKLKQCMSHTTGTATLSACNQYVSPSGSYTWITSGTYQDTIQNVAGCDSIITINLTIKQSTTASVNKTVCHQYVSPSGNHTWTSSGIYNDTIPNGVGCDSVIITNLTVNTSTTATVSKTACGSYTSPSGNYTWTTSGTYQDTIPNTVGCDSVMTIQLTVNQSSSSSINKTACGSYASPSGNYTWTTSGTYQDTIPNALGCDSVMTIQLVVNQSSTSTINKTVCSQYVSPSGNYTWTTSGTYQDTIPNALGCDSIIMIQLVVNQSSTSTINKTVCGQYVSPSGNHTWTSSGTYQDTIPNNVGCDSVMTIQLVVNQSSTSVINKTVCGQYVSPSGNYTWTTSGTYQDTIPNNVGCDSIMTIQLVVNQSGTSSITKTVCKEYVSPSGKFTWTTSGTYQDTISNSVGCDSILSINLTVNKVTDLTVTKSGNSLIAGATNATYQWIDCMTDKAVSGATNKTFKPAKSGKYKVALVQNGCADTSACYNITLVGINENDALEGFSLYPNPTTGQLTIAVDQLQNPIDIEIRNVAGQLMELKQKVTIPRYTFNMNYPSGIYFVTILSEGKRAVFRISKL